MKHEYIKWQRFMFELYIDKNGPFYSRRMRNHSTCFKAAAKLDGYKGLKVKIIDTKKGVNDQNGIQ